MQHFIVLKAERSKLPAECAVCRLVLVYIKLICYHERDCSPSKSSNVAKERWNVWSVVIFFHFATI